MKLKVIVSIGFILLVMTIVSCQSEEQIEFDRYYTGGSLIYQTHCQNCHGAKGEGLAALIPPLTDPVFLKTNRAELSCITKNGLKGKITIAGRQFEGEMPGNVELAPIEIAKALTYITNSFGNKMGTINNQQVDRDLESCK